jgi:hypothetical protein
MGGENQMTIRSALLIAMLGAGSAFAADQAMKDDNAAINSACTSDAQTAGCGADKVGTGLLKCLHAYKEAHKDFKFSDGCKAALEKRHQDKTAGK